MANSEFLDFYKALDLDRNWDAGKLRKEIGSKQKLYMKRQNTTNDKEDLLKIENMLDLIDKARSCLVDPEARNKYDKELDAAYASGMVNDKAEAQGKDVLEKAIYYYNNGQIDMAARLASEAVSNKVNDYRAYEILIRCYYDSEDYERSLETAENAINIFKDNLSLLWLSARLNTIMERYDVAQEKINLMLTIDPYSSLARAEQIHYYMYAEEINIAFQQIDGYVANNPNDIDFKKETAYNLISFTNNCYVEDEETGSLVIADKESYIKCKTICEKAYGLFEDEYTKDCLEDALYFGKKEFNDENTPYLKWLWGTSIIMIIYYFAEYSGGGFEEIKMWAMIIGFWLIPAILMTIVSFRPYWQLFKIYYTGEVGLVETIIVGWGKLATFVIRGTIRLSIALFKWAISLIGA